jgi:hypothetical protein
MGYRESFRNGMEHAWDEIKYTFRPLNIAKCSIIGLLLYNFGSENGCFDSERAEDALRNFAHRKDNVVKTVVGVTEETDPGYNSATWMNPMVTREVEFDDGTEITLRYRTHAWMPMRRWINGDEFSPEVGERYEVTKRNQFVRRM